MAITYTDLFTDIGKFIKAVDLFQASAKSGGSSVPNYNSLLSEIQTRLESQGLQDVLEGLESTFNGFRNTSSSWAQTLSSKVQQRLLHRDTVINQLPGSIEGDIDRTLREIFVDMVAQAESINESVVAVGAPSFVGSGNGQLLSTTLLDGVTAPSPDVQPFSFYRNVESAFPVPSETMSLTCTADEDSDGVPEGHEVFLLEGQPAPGSTFDWKSEGSGISQEITTIQAADTLANRNFESWSSNTPVNWTIESGTPGTDIIQETAAVDVHRGVSALLLDGNGTDIRLVQELPLNIPSPNQHWIFACYIKAASITTGQLTLQVESPSGGYTASSSERILLNAAALGAIPNYTLHYFYLMTPASVPEDLRFVIRYDSTTTGQVWIDSMGFSPLYYANGVGWSLTSGSSQFIRDDRFSVLVTNTEGVFQRFFRRRFRFQLPQSGTPTIADALAQ